MRCEIRGIGDGAIGWPRRCDNLIFAQSIKIMPKKRVTKLGRPFKTVFINVAIRAKTRDDLHELKRITGVRSQGELLDHLVADVMSRRPKGR
jgi:hypothetical protein